MNSVLSFLQNLRQFYDIAVVSIISFAVGFLYVGSIPNGLTWDLGGTDGGELAAAIATNGLVHSPGYPTYLFFGRLFTLFPYQNLALRLNLMSATFALLSVICLAIVLRHLSNVKIGVFPISVALLFWGLQEQLWTQAIIVEVYTLAALFCTLLLLAALLTIHKQSQRWFFGWSIVVGLGVGAHYLTGFIALFTAIWLLFQYVRFAKLLSTFFIALVGFASGLTVYLILPLRAGDILVSNWGNPNTIERFLWVVKATAYADRFDSSAALQRLPLLLGELLAQAGIAGLFLAFVGLSIWANKRRLWLLMGSSLMIVNLWFVAGYVSDDTLPYLYPTLLLLALAVADGVRVVLELSPKRLRSLVGVSLSIAVVLPLLLRTWPLVQTVTTDAEAFARLYTATAPENSVIISDEGRKSFALRYGAAVEQRNDIVLIDLSLLAYDWYRVDVARQLGGAEEFWRDSVTPFTVDRVVNLTAPFRPVRFIDGSTELFEYKLIEDGVFFEPLRFNGNR